MRNYTDLAKYIHKEEGLVNKRSELIQEIGCDSMGHMLDGFHSFTMENTEGTSKFLSKSINNSTGLTVLRREFKECKQ